MQRWSERDYESIFRSYQPTHPNYPPPDECQRLGRELGRSPEAIYAQWDDARGAVLGNKNASSAGLRDYLRRRGWL